MSMSKSAPRIRRLLRSHQEALIHTLLVAGIMLFALYFSVYQIRAHRSLWTGVDLSNVQQTLWNTLNGNFMRSTVYPPTSKYVADFSDRVTESRLGTHVQPFFFVLLLPYALHSTPELLMILLSAAVAMGALPAFMLAKRRVNSNWIALAFAWVYLLLPAVQTNTAWDLHGTSFLPPLLLAGLDAAERGKRTWWWLWIVLAMGCREDVPFLVGWAMLWLAPRERRRTAQVMFGLGLLWSVLSFFVIIPHFGEGGTPFLAFFFPPGTPISLEGILQALRDPKYWLVQAGHFLEYNVFLGLPLLFLYVLNWQVLLAMAPLLLLNGFSWNQAARLPFFSHYSAPIVSWAWLGTVGGGVTLIRFLQRRGPRLRWRFLVVVALLLSTSLVSWMQGYLPFSLAMTWPTSLRTRREIAPLVNKIPAEASLAVNMHLAPQLAHRPTLRFFPDMRDVDWLALDVWNWADPYGPALPVWKEVLADPTWETVVAQDGVLVLRRGSGPPQNVAAAFVSQSADSLKELQVQFGDAWHLTGVEAFPQPWGHFVLCTDWQGAGGGGSVQPMVKLAADAEPQLLRSYRLHPMLYTTSGGFRDCTYLLTPELGGDVTVWLALQQDEIGPLVPVVVEPGAWERRVEREDATLRLEIPAW